jgi:DNA-binding CsgD family transcriptional regulator
VVRATPADAEVATALERLMTALHTVTRFSWSALMTVDPQTLLPTAGVVEGFSADLCAPIWDQELLSPGFNKFTVLARSTDTVATLVEATDGELSRAPVYTELYARLGVADELRAAFVVGRSCWAVATLIRATADGPFPDDEVAAVRNLAPLIARAVKASCYRFDMHAGTSAAMLVVDSANRIVNLTGEADELLDDLRIGGTQEVGLPSVVGTVATRAKSSRTSTQVATRVRGTSGRWLRVTASPMRSGDGQVAMVLEPARAADLTPILLESYGLTHREIEIVMLIARGMPTKDVAAELCLSVHTVRDHVKAIFDKTGHNSRGELVARLFAEHLLDGFHAAVHRME